MIAPKRVPNRVKKSVYLLQKQGFKCPIAESLGIYAKPQDLHHAGVPNTKLNRRVFPRFIHSIWNLKFVNHGLHMNHGSFGRISIKEARSREAFLKAHPCICKKLNMEEDE